MVSRPHGLEEKGFGVKDVVSMRRGIVYASLRAYGWTGPWSNRRGVGGKLATRMESNLIVPLLQFDSLTQTATGINIAEAEAFNSVLPPEEQSKKVPLKTLPVQALDHAAGQLLAFGISAALARTYVVRFLAVLSYFHHFVYL